MTFPLNFSPEIYLQLNPDLVSAGVDPLTHYIDFGALEGRLYGSPQVIECRKINPTFEFILVVSHEASLTGAPVLTYNIVKKLSETYNVILLLLGGGVLIPEFVQSGVCHIECINQRVSSIEKIEYVVRDIVHKFKIKFAILNSTECSSVVEFLAKQFIAVLTLIHEFTSYTRPLDNMGRLLFWSTELIFSSKLIFDNACFYFPDLVNRITHILPQGKCVLPGNIKNLLSSREDTLHFNNIFNTEDIETKKKIILGIGSVHIRKGVDHFIECANLISKYSRFNEWRFIWIGKGYDPELDGNYSIFLKDQIQRSGLSDRLIILGATGEIMKAYHQSDILVIPSRLDPMPNTSIDAISLGIPLVCYDQATGLADILKDEGLGNYCVADYMNTHSMAQKIVNIIDSVEVKNEIYRKFLEINKKYFNFNKYCAKLNEIALAATYKAEHNKSSCNIILKSGLFESNLGAFAHLKNSSNEDQVVSYVNSWSTGLGPPRKGMRGFHPGIYLDKMELKLQGINPLAHYIAAGMPMGEWNYKVISNSDLDNEVNLPLDSSIALHVHVYYIELFGEIIERILVNKIRPDIFITVTNALDKTKVEYLLKNYVLNIISIEILSNLGRNIKPFIDSFHNKIIGKYKYVGHLHTKKSQYDNSDMGKVWINSILNNLLGSRGVPMLDLILSSMENKNLKIGIVVPEDPNIVGWDKNLAIANKILCKLDLQYKLPNSFIFPIGAMFIARCAAIQFIDHQSILNFEYPLEPVPRDGTILHAIERLIGFPKAPFQVAAAYLEGTKR